MDHNLITPILITLAVAWAIYRRVRRNIGRQRIRATRMRWRIGLLGIIGVLVLVVSLRHVELCAALIAGVAGGVVLAWFGLRYTQFETTVQGSFYTPHTYIGVFVSVLLLGRIAYRFVAVYPLMHAAVQANSNPMLGYQKSPLTLAIFGVLVGYYVAYYLGVLHKSRTLAVGVSPARQ